MEQPFNLVLVLSLATLLPFLLASGTCFIKFSIVFVMLRNALGLQQVPSMLTLNGLALLLSMLVMAPIARDSYDYGQQQSMTLSVASMTRFVDEGLGPYRAYLQRYSDPALLAFFQKASEGGGPGAVAANPGLLALLPAYALSEIKSAFRIGFFIYLPFVVIDLVISSILLALGMMMVSPITLSVPVKLILFVSMDGWSLLAKALVMQYIDLPR